MTSAEEPRAVGGRDETATGTVATARARLLGGRGPGADPREIARHTRDRGQIGGVPTTDLLERTAVAAATARGSVPALAAAAAARREQLGDSLDVLVEHLDTARHGLHVGRLTAALVLGTLIGYRLRSRRSARRTAGPRASRPARGLSR